MKTTIKILLLVAIVALSYFVIMSIMTPIKARMVILLALGSSSSRCLISKGNFMLGSRFEDSTRSPARFRTLQETGSHDISHTVREFLERQRFFRLELETPKG